MIEIGNIKISRSMVDIVKNNFDFELISMIRNKIKDESDIKENMWKTNYKPFLVNATKIVLIFSSLYLFWIW